MKVKADRHQKLNSWAPNSILYTHKVVSWLDNIYVNNNSFVDSDVWSCGDFDLEFHNFESRSLVCSWVYTWNFIMIPVKLPSRASWNFKIKCFKCYWEIRLFVITSPNDVITLKCWLIWKPRIRGFHMRYYLICFMWCIIWPRGQQEEFSGKQQFSRHNFAKWHPIATILIYPVSSCWDLSDEVLHVQTLWNLTLVGQNILTPKWPWRRRPITAKNQSTECKTTSYISVNFQDDSLIFTQKIRVSPNLTMDHFVILNFDIDLNKFGWWLLDLYNEDTSSIMRFWWEIRK